MQGCAGWACLSEHSDSIFVSGALYGVYSTTQSAKFQQRGKLLLSPLTSHGFYLIIKLIHIDWKKLEN